MIRKIYLILLLTSFSGILFSQTLDNTTWRIIKEEIPYPTGNYWNFRFTSDITYILNDRINESYKLDQSEKLIQIPTIKEPCSYIVNDDEMKIECSNFALIGEKMSKKYELTQKEFSSKHFNIILPIVENTESLLKDKSLIGEFTSIVNIYVSPFIRQNNQLIDKVGDTYVQVHYQDFRINICDLREYCNNLGYKRKVQNNAILEQLPEHNKTNNSFVVLYIDEQVEIDDVNTIVWRITNISSIKKIYFVIDDANSLTYRPCFKEFNINSSLNTKNSKTYKDWVRNNFPVTKGSVETINIVEDSFQIID
jgi:hypothetical protein